MEEEEELPPTLVTLCLDTIVKQPSDLVAHCMKKRNIFLDTNIAQRLLTKLDSSGRLSSHFLSLFTEDKVRLRSVRLRSKLQFPLALQTLHQHHLVELELRHHIEDFLRGGFGIWCTRFLRHFGCSRSDEPMECVIRKLEAVRGLTSIDMSHTDLNNKSFAKLCQLPCFKEKGLGLRKLNIAGTCVFSLEPLEKIGSKLTYLNLCNVPIIFQLCSTLAKLPLLRDLDISFYEVFENFDHPLLEIIDKGIVFPELVCLNISGWHPPIEPPPLLKFVKSHPKLQFLGMVMCLNQAPPEELNHLQIASEYSKEQMLTALRVYGHRVVLVRMICNAIFDLGRPAPGLGGDLLEAVVNVMQRYPKHESLNQVGTACVCNLTSGSDRAESLPLPILRNAVNYVMRTQEAFSKNESIQINCLLTLYNDVVLSKCLTDQAKRSKVIHLSLASLHSSHIDLTQILLAVVSALSASTLLEDKITYIPILVSLVRYRVDSTSIDETLKQTLAILWSWTDECAASCEVFVQNNGPFVFSLAADVFRHDNSILMQLLGLLNNLAEVHHLLEHFNGMESMLDDCLRNSSIDVSYLAGGVVANLILGGCPWAEPLLPTLERTVDGWNKELLELPVLLVSYRYLRAFLPLLASNVDYHAQLWAAWAVRKLCLQNADKYGPMLLDDGKQGYFLVRNLAQEPSTNGKVKDICQDILTSLRQQGRV